MKIAVCLLAIAVASVGAIDIVEESLVSRSISSSLEDFIIFIREQMPCGFPDLGIPPLAPFIVDNENVGIDLPGFGLNASVENFILRNLDNFEIDEIKLSVIKSTLSFRFTFRNVSVNTFYKLKLFLNKFGFTINLVGDGHAEFEIKELEVSGNIKYHLSVSTNKVKLKSLIVRFHLGEVESNIEGVFDDGPVTEKMNKLIEEILPTLVNNNENLITESIQNLVLPVANDILSAYRLDELLGMIGGGEGEPVKCEPQKQQELY